MIIKMHYGAEDFITVVPIPRQDPPQIRLFSSSGRLFPFFLARQKEKQGVQNTNR